MEYDPLGDCCTAGSNRDYWEKQRTIRGNERSVKGEIQTTKTLPPTNTLVNNAERLADILAWKTSRIPRQMVGRYIELDHKYSNGTMTPDEWREYMLLEVRR